MFSYTFFRIYLRVYNSIKYVKHYLQGNMRFTTIVILDVHEHNGILR